MVNRTPGTGLVSEAMLASYLQSPSGLEQLQDLIAGFLQGGAYDDAGNKYQLPAGGSGGTAGSVNVEAYGALTPWSAGMTAAQTNALLAANDAILEAARAANLGKRLKGPEWPVPTTWNGTSKSLKADLNLMHIAAMTDGTGTVPAKPALTLTNPNGPAQSVTIGTTTVGTTAAAAGMFAETISTATLPLDAGNSDVRKRQGDYSRYRGGDVVEVASSDAPPWADQALSGGTSTYNIWPAEYATVHGILLDVTAVNFSGLANLNNPQTIERRRVRNAGNTLSGLVNGWSFNSGSTTAGQIEFPSLSGDWQVGEAIYDADTGSQIGVAGAMRLAFFGVLEGTYLTNVKLFKVDQSLEVDLKLTCVTNVDPELKLPEAAPTFNIAAPWRPVIDAKVTGVQSRALLLKAAFMGRVELDAWGISNHALNLSNPYAENRYGYGIELRGPCYGVDITGRGGNLRHWKTTNPNQKTYEAASDSHLDYGCGAMFTNVHDVTVTNAYSAAFDSHSGAYREKYSNCRAINPSSGGKWLTAAYGFQDRGIGTVHVDCEVEGGSYGFVQYGANLLAGVKHQPTYIGCRSLGYQVRGWLVAPFLDAYGPALDGVTDLGVYATVVIERCLARGDGGASAQAGFDLGAGVYDLRGNRSEKFSLMPAWLKGGSSSTPSVGRHVWHEGGIYADYSESTGTNPIRIDGEASLLRIFSSFNYMARGTLATPVPAYLFRAVGGATQVQHEGFSGASTADTVAALAVRPQRLELQAGSTATLVDTR